MTRTSTEPATSVNFRMPDSLLKNMDELARQNYHDRTAEINGACKHWVEIGGSAQSENHLNKELTTIKEALQKITTDIAISEEKRDTDLQNLKKSIDGLLAAFENERLLLLKIIEGNEKTINQILLINHRNE